MRKTILFSAVLVGSLLHIPSANAQGEGQPKPKAEPKKVYFGVDSCKGCHSAKDIDDDNVCTSRKSEFPDWFKRDKHRRASIVLLTDPKDPRTMHEGKFQNERSKRMSEILGWPDLTKRKECVNCHGGVYLDTDNNEEKKKVDKTYSVDKTYATAKQRVDSGVSCVACHGPYAKWVNTHSSQAVADPDNPVPAWSTLSKTRKQKEFGLADLFDAKERGRLCFSCHIGDYDADRVVTHEMYAAGHPPLPGIEIATFSEAMPRHWETMSVKIARARRVDAAKKKGDPEPPNGIRFIKNAYEINPDALQLEQTRMVAITCLMAIRTSTDLLANQAKAKLKEDEQAKNRPIGKIAAYNGVKDATGDHWPHLASYDCYACHHDLASDSWRQKRGYDGKPGRIEIRPWSLALGRFGFDLAIGKTTAPGSTPALDRAMSSWQAAFQTVPFGDPKTIVLRAAELDRQLDAKIAELSMQKFDQNKGKEAVRMLVDLASDQLYDFDSARQFAWALKTILREVDPGDAKSAAVLKKLEEDLRLKLPEGPVPIEVDAVYGRISAYRPEPFQRKMLELKRLLTSSRN